MTDLWRGLRSDCYIIDEGTGLGPQIIHGDWSSDEPLPRVLQGQVMAGHYGVPSGIGFIIIRNTKEAVREPK